MKNRITWALLMALCSISFGQSLNERWAYMLDKGNSYKSHKIIRQAELNGMWNVIQDSLRYAKAKLEQEQKKSKGLHSEIVGLELKLRQANASVAEMSEASQKVEAKEDRLHAYITLLWIALGGALGGCFFLYLLYQKSNTTTVQKKSDYDRINESFEAYKLSKLEMERKLKREIQTYANEIEELKSRANKKSVRYAE